MSTMAPHPPTPLRATCRLPACHLEHDLGPAGATVAAAARATAPHADAATALTRIATRRAASAALAACVYPLQRSERLLVQ